MSDIKEMAKLLLAELAPAMGELVKAEVAKFAPTVAPVANVVVDAAEKVFAANNPGIGGAAPDPLTFDGATPETFVTRLNALEAKVDALVQATGHGNSAAMGTHL